MSTTIYSRWKPDTGGFEYLQAPGSYNLNDDLPAPELRPATKIGVPSIEAGRPIPPGAQVVGEGAVAVGVIAPVEASRLVRRTRSLAGIDGSPSPTTLWIIAGAAGLALLWYVRKR
jgi:hypothetical protein